MQRSALNIRSIKPSQYKTGVSSVEVAQLVSESRTYNSKKANTGFGESLVAESDFGFASNTYTNESTRVTWIPVPSSYTEEQVKALIAQCPNPGIKRILSSEPILSTDQQRAIDAGLTTKRDIAYGRDGKSGQLRRYPATANNGQAGQPILDQYGKEQFAVNVFVKDIVASPDVDLRTSDVPQATATPAAAPTRISNAGQLNGQSVPVAPATTVPQTAEVPTL